MFYVAISLFCFVLGFIFGEARGYTTGRESMSEPLRRLTVANEALRSVILERVGKCAHME